MRNTNHHIHRRDSGCPFPAATASAEHPSPASRPSLATRCRARLSAASAATSRSPTVASTASTSVGPRPAHPRPRHRAADGRAAAAAGQTAQFGAGSPERAVDCTLAREAAERFQMVIYARPASAADRYDDSRPIIRTQMRRMNWVLNRDSLASGGPTADYRVACNFPLADQTIFVGQWSPGLLAADIVAAAKAGGWFDYRAAHDLLRRGGSHGRRVRHRQHLQRRFAVGEQPQQQPGHRRRNRRLRGDLPELLERQHSDARERPQPGRRAEQRAALDR